MADAKKNIEKSRKKKIKEEKKRREKERKAEQKRRDQAIKRANKKRKKKLKEDVITPRKDVRKIDTTKRNTRTINEANEVNSNIGRSYIRNIV